MCGVRGEWIRVVEGGGVGRGSKLTLRISLQMYAMQSSFSAFPFVFFTRSVTEPAPQNSITS